MEFSTDWLTDSLSDKCNSITTKATSLIFSLFDVASAWEVPFGIPQYVQCILHGLTSVLFCVPFIFVDSEKCRFGNSTRWLPFLMEIVHIFHSGCFGCRGAFQIVLDLYCCVTGWTQPTTKCNGYFTFQTIIDITGPRGTISFGMHGLQVFRTVLGLKNAVWQVEHSWQWSIMDTSLFRYSWDTWCHFGCSMCGFTSHNNNIYKKS